jgi:hypothetical protein
MNKKSISARVAALFVSPSELRLAIASVGADRRYQVELDGCALEEGSSRSRWDWEQFQDRLQGLTQKWDLAGIPLHLALDSDFCVTRVSTGSAERVTKELEQLAQRVPRYLSLGPGTKLTGHQRMTIAPGLDYAVTAVANRNAVEKLFASLYQCKLQPVSAEPSMVSAARLIGKTRLDQQRPILLADCSGKTWHLGICHQGRLLLAYRPSAAWSATEFARVLDDHMPRLLRFCRRHRQLVDGDPDELYVIGPEDTTSKAVQALQQVSRVQVRPLDVHEDAFPGNLKTDVGRIGSIPALGALLPSIDPQANWIVPDISHSIEKQCTRTKRNRLLTTYWPAIASSVVLAGGWASLHLTRYHAGRHLEEKASVAQEVRIAQVRLSEFAADQEELKNLTNLQQHLGSTSWDQLLKSITECFPERTRIESIRFEGNEQVHLKGLVSQETQVFELVGWLRQLPQVREVALDGTAPAVAMGTECLIRLKLAQSPQPK